MTRLKLPVLATAIAVLPALLMEPAGARAQVPEGAQEGESESVAPFVPTSMHVVGEMLEMAGVTARDTVYDLGSGDGRLPIAAARVHGAFGVGVELDSALVARSRRRARDAGVDGRVRFIRGDLFRTDLATASVVTLYLFPEANIRLRPKLFRELDPGDRVVAHDFAMGEWEADSIVHISGSTSSAPEDSLVGLDSIALDSDASDLELEIGPDLSLEVPDPEARLDTLTPVSPSPVPGPSTLYLWVIPANVDGTWSLRLPDGRTTVKIDQRFQELRIRAEEGPYEAVSARIEGARVRLALQGPDGGTLRLEGTVRDGRMEGRTAAGERWTARRLERGKGSVLEWEVPEAAALLE